MKGQESYLGKFKVIHPDNFIITARNIGLIFYVVHIAIQEFVQTLHKLNDHLVLIAWQIVMNFSSL
jgi:hypothetical protein